MTSFLNYVTATLRALFAWRGSHVLEVSVYRDAETATTVPGGRFVTDTVYVHHAARVVVPEIARELWSVETVYVPVDHVISVAAPGTVRQTWSVDAEDAGPSRPAPSSKDFA